MSPPPASSRLAALAESPAGLAALVILAAMVLAGGLGLRDPWPSDEPRFALMAKDMVESGDWLFPRRGGELYPDKPPLFMWAQAIAYTATGSIAVAFMLPNLLAALGVLVIVYDMARRCWDRRAAFAGTALLLVTPMFLVQAPSGQIDMLATFWIALAVYSILRYLLHAGSPLWLYAGFVSSGLGVITKGVGFLPLLMLLCLPLYRVALPELRRVGVQRALLGLVLCLATIGTWLVPMLLAVDASSDPAMSEYRDNILLQQTAQRYAAPSHHFQPWWYFLVEVIPALWLPIVLLLPWLAPGWVRALKTRDPATVLTLLWAILVILFFSLSPGKRGVYILPALPWVAFAAGPVLARVGRGKGILILDLVAAFMLALALCSLGALLLADESFVAPVWEPYASGVGAWAIGVGITALIASAMAAKTRKPVAYVGTVLLTWFAAGIWLFPQVNDARSGRALMAEVDRRVSPDTPLAMVNWKEQLLLQSRRPIENFGFRVPITIQVESAVDWLEATEAGKVLLQDSELEPCFDADGAEFVGEAHRRRWYLVDATVTAPACRPAKDAVG